MKTKISSLITVIVLFTFNSYSQTTDSVPPPVSQVKDFQITLPKGAVQFTPDQMQWVAGPEALPKGTKMCVLYGDMTKEGPFAIRLKLPANQIIKLHVHKNDEVITVIEGAVMVGFGDRMQMSKTKTFTAGSFYVNPAKEKHFVAIDKDGATVQLNSMGPWGIDFK
ncbi:MAG: cupin domain-containing protein [Bacteroidia bacterium]